MRERVQTAIVLTIAVSTLVLRYLAIRCFALYNFEDDDAMTNCIKLANINTAAPSSAEIEMMMAVPILSCILSCCCPWILNKESDDACFEDDDHAFLALLGFLVAFTIEEFIYLVLFAHFSAYICGLNAVFPDECSLNDDFRSALHHTIAGLIVSVFIFIAATVLIVLQTKLVKAWGFRDLQRFWLSQRNFDQSATIPAIRTIILILGSAAIQPPAQSELADQEHTHHLDQLSEEIESKDDPWNCSFIHLPTEHPSIDTDEKTVDASCNIAHCQYFDRISSVLRKYYEADCKVNMIFNDKNNINITAVLNDNQHLLFLHQREFEQIHNTLNQNQFGNKGSSCDSNDCAIVKRRTQTTNMYDDTLCFEEAVQQKMLDAIHCYYFHSFDHGYRMRANDRTNDEYVTFSEMKRCGDMQRQNNTAQTRYKHNRYGTNEQCTLYDEGIRYFYCLKDEANQCAKDPVLQQNTIAAAFSVYPETKHRANKGYSVGEWYVEKKYEQLKDELLNNTVCATNANCFRGLQQEATEHHQTDYAKAITAFSDNIAYEIKKGTPISKEHLLAMMVYCDCDVLQSKFSETYRRKEHESDESLKQRHAQFANLGRLLREFVECFGQSGVSQHDLANTILYHGISQQAQFSALQIRITGPLSATPQLEVANGFASNGLVLQFSLSPECVFGERSHTLIEPFDNQCAFVDCHWLSHYPQEQERFFIGGYSYFYIESIISMQFMANYAVYIQAMRIIFETIMDSSNMNLEGFTILDKTVLHKVAFALLCNELHRYFPSTYRSYAWIPTYIQHFFHNFCVDDQAAVFFRCADKDYCIDFDYKPIKKMCQSLFLYDSGVVKWDVVVKVFPAAERICILTKNAFDFRNVELICNEQFWNSLFWFLRARSVENYITIAVELCSAGLEFEDYKLKCRKAVASMQSLYDFDSIGWLVHIDGDSDLKLVVGSKLHLLHALSVPVEGDL